MDIEKKKNRFEVEEFEKLKNIMVKYNCALEIVMTHLNNLNTYYNAFEPVNPIEHIKRRIKSPESIAGKLNKKGLPLTAEIADQTLHDIAGIRIICAYAKNIYEIVEIIKNQADFTVIREKDYLMAPKESGYRSYHLIVELNLGRLFGDQICQVEIQLRTSAMDFWATLEHKVKYKYEGKMPEFLSQELQISAEQIHELDERMYHIHELVDEINEDLI
ncbi:GTP pyrophosphokinase family protein [Lactococcus hircilactis]|uniref:GTP pyrophosphokinase family protein n=1 Tax=Lactococcus hircilactis TaxID=1494462 RepID=A0A7X1Z8X9_9LACT|nr:GTP pyrophosphokinase family protein [Lactococcus hircilactis]MQW39918.1 GTP pyrophosphokinase family protein [Lactococcus hircilactis]